MIVRTKNREFNFHVPGCPFRWPHHLKEHHEMTESDRHPSLKLTVSELAAFASCPRCVQLKWRDHVDLVPADHPRKYRDARGVSKKHFAGRRTQDVWPSLSPGRFRAKGTKLTSQPLLVPRHSAPLVISGSIPIPIELDGGGFAIHRPSLALQTSHNRASFALQLHAYALLAERPEDSSRGFSPVEELWILWCSEHGDRLTIDGCEAVPRDAGWFIEQLACIGDLVRSPTNFPASPNCSRRH